MQILVVNPGATSTKIAVFFNDIPVFVRTVEHTTDQLAQYEGKPIVAQLNFRRQLILDTLYEAGYVPSDFDAVCGRGGLLRHIPSGTYEVTERVLKDIESPPYGEHASNLGTVLAKSIADMAGVKAYFVDPVSVDEMTPVAHVSGFKGMERESFFHALNQKGMARRASEILGKAYEELNLIVVHMGGGVSVAAHDHGRVVDVFNVKDEGSFAMDRGGSLPVNAVINYCFSGKTKAEVKRELGSQAGVYSYLGTRDFREVENRAFSGDEQAKLIFDALIYQHAKDIGAMAAVLRFNVDAVVLTGGIANSERLCNTLKGYLEKLAPVLVLPGEEEMRSLAMGALRVLRGESAKVY